MYLVIIIRAIDISRSYTDHIFININILIRKNKYHT